MADIDLDRFFREATLRICGELEVEGFLQPAFDYLRTYLPAARVVLSYFYPREGRQVILAAASAEGCRVEPQTLVQAASVRRFIQRPGLETLVVDRAEGHPTARAWIDQGLLAPDSSLLLVRVIVRENLYGSVIFIARRHRRFSARHAELVDVLREPLSIALANSVRYQELRELKETLAADYRALQNDVLPAAGQSVVGADAGLRPVMEMVRHVAPMVSPVLLLGETGTGKELLAAAIHRLSPRRDGPLIKVNCGAIPESLIDAELFGHEKGAFTGALARRRGRFERADGGTLFLDEIGELRPEAQVRLLRVLQEKAFERVGGVESLKADVRIVAATHRDLERRVADGRFRQDLYFRLAVFPIAIPPLRRRPEDIPALVQHFILKKYREIGLQRMPVPAPGAVESLMRHEWPGNVRELENTVERAMILSRGRPLDFADVLPQPGMPPEARPAVVPGVGSEPLAPLDRVIREHIERALYAAGGRVGGDRGAARLLGVNPSTLRKRMRKHRIPFGRAASDLYQTPVGQGRPSPCGPSRSMD